MNMVELADLVVEQGNALKAWRDKKGAQIEEIVERLDQIELRSNRVQLGFGDSKAPASQGRSSLISHSVKTAMERFARKGDVSGLSEAKGMSTDSGPDGGYFVPEEIDYAIDKLIMDQSPMRQICLVRPSNAGSLRRIVNAGGTNSGWAGERQARPETETPDLKAVTITAHELYANPALTQKILDDAGFDAAQWLQDEIVEEFVAQENTAFVLGDGIEKPRGFLTYPTAAQGDAVREFGTLEHLVTGQAATLPTTNPADLFIQLVFKLKAGYRQGAVWLMNSNTLSLVMRFKDGQGNLIWQPSLREGVPSTLCGYPVYECEDMPDVGAGAVPVAFGNFQRGYTIVDRKQTAILRDPFTNKPYVHFYAVRRVGGALVNSEAIKLIKVAAN